MIVMIASTSRYSLPGLISVGTYINCDTQIQQYDINCIVSTIWFYFAGACCLVFEPEPLNIIDSVKTILRATCVEKPLEANFCGQSTVSLPWNAYWTDLAREGGGLNIKDPVLAPHWTGYSGAHSWFLCDLEELCDCAGHNCSGTHSTI